MWSSCPLKSMDWFLYHNGLRHERVKRLTEKIVSLNSVTTKSLDDGKEQYQELLNEVVPKYYNQWKAFTGLIKDWIYSFASCYPQRITIQYLQYSFLFLSVTYLCLSSINKGLKQTKNSLWKIYQKVVLYFWD